MILKTNGWILILFVIILGNIVCGQYINNKTSRIEVNVEKKLCSINGMKSSKLVIHLKEGNIEKISKTNNYGMTEFVKLNDSIKLLIVEKLLDFKNDTSAVCINVSNYGFEGYENTCNYKPQTNLYSIQVDALYMINKLCFPHASSFYYCYPLLFDTLTKMEINGRDSSIEDFFKIYETWFVKTKSKGTIDNDFPFNTGRYIWYGGRKSDPKTD